MIFFNPRRAGGRFYAPPSGFSQIAGKRRRAAPPNLAYLFSHLFRISCPKISTIWPKVRSPGHFEWPYLTKSLNLHQSYNCWAIDIKVSGVDEGDSIYKTYISDFWYLWPEVRSISRPPHYKSMGEISTSSECYPIHSIWSGSWYYKFLSVISPKNITCDLWMVSLGHPRSPQGTNGFSAITSDWKEIEPPGNVHCVCLVNADRMICNMTNFGQVMTLTWGQMFNLTFRGHVIHHSMRLDELRTMACESFLYLCWIKSNYRKTIRNENEHFFFGDLWWPSFWPDRKNDRSSFLLILTALSNAACRLSLRRSGVELDGGA